MWRSRVSDDTGAVAVTFAIVFLVLVAFAALAVDVGFWYTAKRQLQTAADAAALAGCKELSENAASGVIAGAAETYAGHNFTTPLDASPVSRVTETEIGSDYVKVTCETDAPVFLAHFILNSRTTLIRAQSVAKIGFLAGGRGPVPWGLAILDVDEMIGILGGESLALSPDGDYWRTTFSQGSTGALDIVATNSRGYEGTFEDLIGVGALPSGGRIVEIDVDRSTLTSGVHGSVRVSVQLASPLAEGGSVTAEIGKKGSKVTLTPVTETLYRATVPVGTTAEAQIPLECEVELKEGKDAKQTAAFQLMLRRASYILQDVDVHPVAVQPTGAVTVRVKTLDFEYGIPYELKVAGGAGEYGNFQALALGVIDHSECGHADDSTNDPGGSDYRDNIVGNDDLILHLLDIIDTEPGNMTGPTKQGINERLTPPLMTLEEWEAAGRPDTKQVCIVPIVELIEDLGGRSQVQVVSFATFFIESTLTNDDTVHGRFVEWTAPGWLVVDDPPPGGLVIEAVHLTDQHLDF